MEYDGGGRKLVQHYDPKQGGNGVDKRDEYVFDGLDPVAEYDMLNGQRSDYYRGAGGHIALMHQYKGGTRGQMYWYHYNNKGDVVGLTKQNGNSHHNYRYDPYGAVLPENGNFTDPHNHYTLTGKEFDENTGLVWFGARYYEPETGVWMGQDVYRGSIADPMSLHRYGYVGNNPVNGWDYYGYILTKIMDKTKYVNPTYWLSKAIDGGKSWDDGINFGYQYVDPVVNKYGHDVLDVVGLVPAFGEPADGVNALWYEAEGDHLNAGLSGAGMVPFAGWGATGGKFVKKCNKYVPDSVKLKFARTIGKAGEEAVRAKNYIGDKVGILINGRYRIPDGLDKVNKILSEVKNVKSLSFTRQLRDYLDFAGKENMRFDLYVRKTTELTKPLREAIKEGLINLKFIDE